MDYNDQDLVSFVLKSLIKFGKQRRSIVIKFDPFIQLTRYLSNGQVIENPSTFEIKDRLISQGCNWSGRVHTLWETVQPTFHAVLKEESFSEGSLNKKVRQNIRTARNKGIDVYVGREDLLEDFSEILKKTEE
ncbi:peptidoglycan bridge formation glycyltransferase FemA/FemB family protein, partial [Streptococcus suis]|uniref:peptidoglycan bridge formation glycyltransferase FemA/FemB family protein n=1 Tax=Streptococcus suis TaxID=1307 RepID=UPI001EE777BB